MNGRVRNFGLVILSYFCLFGSASAEISGSVGMLAQNLKKTASDSAGATGLSGRNSLMVGVQGSWMSLYPTFLVSPLAQTTMDKAASTRVFYLGIPYGIFETDIISVRLGTGLLFTKYSGKGGTVELNNGETVSTFAKPSRSTSATNVLATLGVHGPLFNQLFWGADALVTGAFSTKRTVNFLLSANYQF
jgi:hypothetical protein